MPGTSKYEHLLLASIVARNGWRDDQRLLGMFMWWIHKHCGLAWQRNFYAISDSLMNDNALVESVAIHIHNNNVSRIEVESSAGRNTYSAVEMAPATLCRMLWSAGNISTIGLSESGIDKVLSDQNLFRLGQSSALYGKLTSEYIGVRKYKSHHRRLWGKLLKDPVLFFRDSDRLAGRSVYRLMRLIRLEKKL